MLPSLLLLFAACAHPPAPPVAAQPVEMPAHGAAAQAVRDALVRGTLDEAKAAVAPLVSLAMPAGLESPAAVATRAAAAEVQGAADLRAAALGTGRMLAACGSCHQDLPQQQQPTPAGPPDEEGGVVREMTRHAWALDRMWGAVLWPDPDAFSAAARALNQEDLVTGHGTQALPEGMQALEAQLHGLAVGAGNADGGADQARLLGEMMHTCGACHAGVGARP